VAAQKVPCGRFRRRVVLLLVCKIIIVLSELQCKMERDAIVNPFTARKDKNPNLHFGAVPH
jgi:hypothetical protein